MNQTNIQKATDTELKVLKALIDQELINRNPKNEQTLNTRFWNILENSEVKTLQELSKFTKNEFLKFRNVSKKTLQFAEEALAEEALAEEGLSFKNHIIVLFDSINKRYATEKTRGYSHNVRWSLNVARAYSYATKQAAQKDIKAYNEYFQKSNPYVYEKNKSVFKVVKLKL